MMTSVKIITSYSRSCYFFFENFKVTYICVKFQVNINSSSLYRKKYDGDNFTLTPRKRLRDQSMLVGNGLIELTEPSDTLDNKRFFKHCILQFTLIFSAYICVKQNLLF